MLGLGFSVPTAALQRQARARHVYKAALKFDASSQITGTNSNVATVMADGTYNAQLTALGQGGVIERVADGFQFSAGQYLSWQHGDTDWTGALIVLDFTLLGDPTGTGFLVRLSAAADGKMYLRYFDNAVVDTVGPGNQRIAYDTMKEIGERQTLGLLVEPAEGGAAAGSKMVLLNADGIPIEDGHVDPMGNISLNDVRIGMNANVIIHELAIYPTKVNTGLPAPASTLWQQTFAQKRRAYNPALTEILPVNGQSLALGPATSQSGKQMLNYADRHGVKMLTGLERSDAVPVGLMGPGALGYNTAVEEGEIAPSRITNNLMIGHPVGVALNMLRLPGSPPVLTGFFGYGGERIDDMDEDPATGPGEITIFESNRHWLGEAVRTIEKHGGQATCGYSLLVQGQGDKNRAAGVWRDGVERFLQDHQRSVQNVIPGAFPKLVLSQTNGDIDTTGDTWNVKAEQLKYASDTGALLVPLYPYATADAGGIHPGEAQTVQFSEVFAWAIHSDESGQGWNINKPVTQLSGNDLKLIFDLREGENLVAHDSGKYLGEGISDLGFEVEGASVASVVLSGNTVTLHCDATPQSWRYAMQSQNLTGATMPYPAHRGLLRTDITLTGPISGEPLYRWVPSIESSPV
ncbi:MAG: hypothetical protein ACPGUX_11625 [Halocynthiibacter sp.]